MAAQTYITNEHGLNIKINQLGLKSLHVQRIASEIAELLQGTKFDVRSRLSTEFMENHAYAAIDLDTDITDAAELARFLGSVAEIKGVEELSVYIADAYDTHTRVIWMGETFEVSTELSNEIKIERSRNSEAKFNDLQSKTRQLRLEVDKAMEESRKVLK
ncbi:hypothetical protein LNV23_22780 [Paucibacter sp. DJ1R-11]|uniref:hypothetical protein n=1 Tax=Paucibacter sp. DJ1R-11 TaxID=2893556 RepID=UPI0021E480DF|nr:hypothetical protein [Paucibacter sp. DJ1R-11]MCV2366271.1 hypothetical protein [Paucibacter sp. DJ1R-11]